MTKALFLSTVSSEFGNLRVDQANHFNRLNCGIDIHHQEAFFQPGTGTFKMLERHVKECGVVVHVIGAQEGWIPPADQVAQFLDDNPAFASRFPDVTNDARAGKISATQWEAWLAAYFGKKLHSYSFPERLTKGTSQEIHASRLAEAHLHPKPVVNELMLYLEILGSLHEDGWLTREQIGRKIAPSRILRHPSKQLFGREKWLDSLDAALANPTLHIYTLVAWGGVGKTSLVAHWVSQRLAKKGWLNVEQYFDWSFYSQGTGESRQTSSDMFIQEALRHFGDTDPYQGTPWERGERLAGLVRQSYTLLILDGIEPLQYPINDPRAGQLKDEAMEALLQSLALNNKGLCIVTTREHLKNIESQATVEEQKLDQLEKESAIEMLRDMQITGPDKELEEAHHAVSGHALSLQLLGRFLADAHGGDIRYMREVKFEEADNDRQGRSAFKVMIAYEKWLASAGQEHQRELAILRLTGLFDRPISRDCLAALRAEPPIAGLTDDLIRLKEPQWNIAIARLREIDLLSVTYDSIDAHPLIREYFTKQLMKTQPKAFKVAHSRLFDHLCKSTPYRPDTIEQLSPLYQAIAHGCLAGRSEEAFEDVYKRRITRGSEKYSLNKLGAFNSDLTALAFFFQIQWDQVAPTIAEADHAWLLNQVSYCLRSLGRLTDAQIPLKASLAVSVHRNDLLTTAIRASSLSELMLTFGEMELAIEYGELSVRHAEQQNDVFWKIVANTTLAEALHHSGKQQKAHLHFQNAEALQSEHQPKYPLLSSYQGFRYCEILLQESERRAWQHTLGTPFFRIEENAPNTRYIPDMDATCLAVAQRAKTMIAWWTKDLPNPWELTLALHYLTCARADFYRTIITNPDINFMTSQILSNSEKSLASFRRASQLSKLILGLLTRAWLRSLTGLPEGARADLDDAWAIASRGQMRLHMSDIHLHRARLFCDKSELAKAAKMIRNLEYGRRYDELNDAEFASELW